MPFELFSITAKSPKLPTIQQDYLQVVYLNITYLNKTQLFGHSSGKEHVHEGGKWRKNEKGEVQGGVQAD